MLSVALSHLRVHKFKHSFDDTLNALVETDVETAPHCFFHYAFLNFCWMLHSPQHYELNWWCNINQK